jgi:hypothetical protein
LVFWTKKNLATLCDGGSGQKYWQRTTFSVKRAFSVDKFEMLNEKNRYRKK